MQHQMITLHESVIELLCVGNHLDESAMKNCTATGKTVQGELLYVAMCQLHFFQCDSRRDYLDLPSLGPSSHYHRISS